MISIPKDLYNDSFLKNRADVIEQVNRSQILV